MLSVFSVQFGERWGDDDDEDDDDGSVWASGDSDSSSRVLADHSWSGLGGPDTDANAAHSQGPPGQDLCNALGERLQVG